MIFCEKKKIGEQELGWFFFGDDSIFLETHVYCGGMWWIYYICCNWFSCVFVAFATDGPTLVSMVAESGSIFAKMPSIFGSFFFQR